MAKKGKKKKTKEEKDLVQPEKETAKDSVEESEAEKPMEESETENPAVESETGATAEEGETEETPKKPETEEIAGESEAEDTVEESETEELTEEPEGKETSEKPESEEVVEEPEEGESAEKSEAEEPAGESETEESAEEPKAGRSRKTRLRNRCIVAAVIIGLYLAVGGYYSFHFQPRTVINGIACAGMSEKELETAVAEKVQDYELTLVERQGDTELLIGGDFDLHAVFDDSFEEILLDQRPFLWPRALFRKRVYEPGQAVEWDEKLLSDAVNGLVCMDESGMIRPENARVVYSAEEDALVITDAEYGTTIRSDVLTQAVEEAIRSLADTLDLAESGCYQEPKITEDMPELIAACEEMNGMIDLTITYDMLDIGEIPITKEQMSTWVRVNDSLVVSYDWKAIEAFVADFAAQYDTRDKDHTLQTTWGSTVTITNVAYGWQLDQKSEVEALLADLRAGEDVTREPVWAYTANSHGENDYGDTYLEANLTEQHLYFYKNGKLIVESDFVSGSVAGGHATHTGIFDVDYKQMHVVLRGPGYASPVTYWMPFNGGEGLHDATWRSRFGGSIYQTDGSHGCLNLPYGVAQTIYENIEAGDCVIVYK